MESFIKVVRYNLEKVKFYLRTSGELTSFWDFTRLLPRWHSRLCVKPYILFCIDTKNSACRFQRVS